MTSHQMGIELSVVTIEPKEEIVVLEVTDEIKQDRGSKCKRQLKWRVVLMRLLGW